MKNYVEVQGFPGYVRDLETGAILNTNFDKIEKARKAKRLKEEQKKEKAELDSRLSRIENDMSEIKQALSTLLKTYK